MSYQRRRLVPRRPGMSGLGALGYSDADQCSVIPIGDPYRKPGNYCATPDGGMTTFNADGSTYRQPGAVDPDPAHPAGSTPSKVGTVLSSLFPFLSPPVATGPMMPISTGPSTTTIAILAGAGVLGAWLLSRR